MQRYMRGRSRSFLDNHSPGDSLEKNVFLILSRFMGPGCRKKDKISMTKLKNEQSKTLKSIQLPVILLIVSIFYPWLLFGEKKIWIKQMERLIASPALPLL